MHKEVERAEVEILQEIGFRNRLRRSVWLLSCLVFFRYTPVIMHRWRRYVLKLFGAQLGARVYVYPSVRIWAPWNLNMQDGSCLAAEVECYNVAPIALGPRALVSQRAHLCTASHNFDDPEFPLVGAPITLEADSWVTAEVFVAPGVTLREGAVALARSVVTKDVPAWTVVAGNPARSLRQRRKPGS